MDSDLNNTTGVAKPTGLSRFKPTDWIVFTLVLVTAFGAVWLGIVSTDPFGFDLWWQTRIVVPQESLFIFDLAYVFHILGSSLGTGLVTLVLLSTLVLMKQWLPALTLLSTMISVVVISQLVKFLVARPRPLEMLVEQSEYSFPSGHSLGAAALATALVSITFASTRVSRTGSLIALLLGILYTVVMMWSRTALNVHWASDTIAGACLGIALGLLWSRLLLRSTQA